jgi:putative phosphoribosyl transferase
MASRKGGALFADRIDAGRQLAARLTARDDLSGGDVVVVGLPRGGVPVAAPVAAALGAPLDVIVVRKLGTPGQEELAMGAIAELDERVVEPRVVAHLGIDAAALDRVEARERAELERRVHAWRGERGRLSLRDCVVVVVDDGLATGSTARVAVAAARHAGARKVLVAVPVAPVDLDAAALGADELVVVARPRTFGAVGRFYDNFEPVPDAEVARLLELGSGSPRPSELP